MTPFKYILFCTSFLIATLLHGTALADTKDIPSEFIVNNATTATFGYQSFSLKNAANRAAEYRSFSSGPTFELKSFNDSEKANFSIDATFLSDEDFNAVIDYNRGSLLRLNLRSVRFYHNLDHIPYDNGYIGDGDLRIPDHTPAEGSRPDGVFDSDNRTYYTDHDPEAAYGQEININEVKVRTKLPSYPAHLNLAYWRMEKTGHRQMRFVDENCTGCHMQSRSRTIDRVTNELKASVDGHFGYLDLEASALYREFKDEEPIPSDRFEDHYMGRETGSFEHAEDPDATLKEITLRANTSPSGGLVGSASLTFGKRENESDLIAISPVKAEADYFKTAADVTYTPGANWTINLRQRYLDIDNDNSSTLSAPNYGSTNPNDLDVRQSIDFTRAWYEITGNYRPSGNLTFKAELRREDIKRDHTGPPADHSSALVITPVYNTAAITIDPYWELPAEESLTKLKIGFHSRLLEKSALKLSGWASLKRNDDPAYGTSFSDSRELFLSSRYAPSQFWGLSASLDLLDEYNNDRIALQFDGNSASELASFDLGRERAQQNLSLGGWLVPSEGVTIDFSYGYMATQIEQDLLFGRQANTDPAESARDFTIESENTDYEQTVHTISAGANWQMLENLSCRVEGYHIRSKAHYDPDFASRSLNFGYAAPFVSGTASSSELRGLSEIDIRQNGVKARANWQIDENWSCSVNTSYDKYDDQNSNIFDGSVITYMANLSRRW